MGRQLMVVRLLSCILLLAPLGCKSDHGTQPVKEVEVRPNVDVQIPLELWDKIESVYTGRASKLATAMQAEKIDIFSDAHASQVPLRFMKISVRLNEVEHGALGSSDYALNYGQGGGDLDLADYVKGEYGSFKISVEVPENTGEVEKFKVFVWPNGKMRNIKGVIYGNSCEKMYDVTDYFTANLAHSGVQLAISAKKYLTSLAGTYVFAVKKNSTLYVAHLTVKDSRYQVLQCRS